MRDQPPAELTALLARLHLATPEEVRAARGRARRLARHLPLFESVWVDALAQARVLTPFQAAEINAARGERLLVGPYVLRGPMASLGYADVYAAADAASCRKVHLVVARGLTPERAQDAAAKLQSTVEQVAALASTGLARLEAAGAGDDTVWAAYCPATGLAVNHWLSCQGRFPPRVAAEIVRQMIAALAALEAAGLVHGDIAATSLWIAESGKVQLTRCGVRAVVRPDEASRNAPMPPDAFDYLAPERLVAPGQPTVAGDLYACGCLWWQLLTGRPPRVGGNVSEKLRAVRQATIPDVRPFAPDTPPALAEAIRRCTQYAPADRPASFTELMDLLGASGEAGRRRIAAAVLRSGRRTMPRPLSWKVQTGLQRAGAHLAAAAACAALLAAATWPIWRSRPSADQQVAMSAQVSYGNNLASLPRAQHQSDRIVNRPTQQATTPGSDEAAERVQLASYEATDKKSPPVAAPNPPPAPVIELPSDKEIPGSTLRLTTNAVVRAKGEGRLRIAAPPTGLVVSADDVRFENVDFVWHQRPEAVTTPDRHAIVDVRASHVTFVGCTFQASEVAGFELPPAIRLSGRAEYSAALAPAGHVELERCALSGVACGIDCRLTGPAAVDMRDTLHLGRGALVRFAEVRRPDAPASLTLQQVTVRGASSVVELQADDSPEGMAAITVSAAACVFAPHDEGALLVFSGLRPGQRLLKAVEWSGQGSLATPPSAVAIWRGASARDSLPEDEVPIEGLVFSTVEFEGEPSGDPAASLVRRWLAPGRSEGPPGIQSDVPKLPPLEMPSSGAR